MSSTRGSARRAVTSATASGRHGRGAAYGRLILALALEECRQGTPIPDADGDGERDGTDACPDTSAGAAVDPAGCSLDQFCRATSVSGKNGPKNCQSADWKNDEPMLGKSDADCELR